MHINKEGQNEPTQKKGLTFLDFLDGRHCCSIAAHYHAHARHRELGGREHGGGAVGGVGEEGAAEALPPALPPVAVNGCLEFIGIAQPPLITFIRVKVLHVSVVEKMVLEINPH